MHTLSFSLNTKNMRNSVPISLQFITILIPVPNQTRLPTSDPPLSSLPHPKKPLAKLHPDLSLSYRTNPEIPFLVDITTGTFKQDLGRWFERESFEIGV